MYSNCELTELVEATETELDEAEKIQMYEQIQQVILDDGPFAITFYPLNQFAYANYLKGFVSMNSISYIEFWGVYKE